MTIIGMAVVREAIRLSAIDISLYQEQHVKAAAVGGLAAFLFFFALNAGLIVWCFRIVRRGFSQGHQ